MYSLYVYISLSFYNWLNATQRLTSMIKRLITYTLVFFIIQFENVYAQPVNDDCSTATLLACGSSIVGASTVSSTDNGDILGCTTGVGVWYKILPAVSETYEIIISNPTYFYEIAIAEGSNCTGFENILCSFGSGSADRTFYFYAEANKEYYIYIGDDTDNGILDGTFDIVINCLTPPANVVCSTATQLSCGSNLIAETSNGSIDSADDLGCSSGIGVWYEFIPSSTQTIEVVVDNITFSFDLILAEGSTCGNLINLQCMAGSRFSDNKMNFLAEQGKEYRLYVGDNDNGGQETGTFDLSLECLTPAVNYQCSNATVLNCGDDLMGETTVGAVDNNDLLVPCSIGVGTWYTITPATSETIELIFTDLDFVHEVSIAEATGCGNFNVLECRRIFQSTLDQKIVFAGVAGQQYVIVVGDDSPIGTDTGTFNLQVNCVPPPSNDLCTTATELFCGTTLVNESSVGSTDNGDATGTSCNTGVGVWYSFTPTSVDPHEIVVENVSYDIFFTVSSSSDCQSFTSVTCRAVNIGQSNTYIVQPSIGVTYYVYIADRSNGTDSGTYDVSLQCYAIASNASCTTPKSIQCGDQFVAESTTGAISFPTGISGCSPGLGVWYRYTNAESKTIRMIIENMTESLEYVVMSSSDCNTFDRIACSTVAANNNFFDVVFFAEQDLDYYIFIGNTTSGVTEYFDFDISIDCFEPPSNIDCSSAKPLDCNVPLLNESTTGSIRNSPSGNFGGVGTWYTFTAEVTETVTVRITNATEDFAIVGRTSMNCTSFSGGSVSLSTTPEDSILFVVQAGLDYYIYVGDRIPTGTTYFDFDIELECNSSITNNECATATVITCGDVLLQESTLGATDDIPGFTCPVGAGVWYEFSSIEFGTAFIEVTPDVNYDPTVLVRRSNDCFTFTDVLCSRTVGDGVVEVFDFAFEPDSSYYIYVGDRTGNNFGSFDLSINCGICPTGDYAGQNALMGIQSMSEDYETNGLIESSQVITGAIDVDYDSRTGIVLEENFSVAKGSILHAFIDGCGGG